MSLFKVLSLTLILTSLNPTYAANPIQTESEIDYSCDAALVVGEKDSARSLETAPFPPLSEAFPYGRGLIDTKVPVTPENILKAKSLGIKDWGLRIYPVSSY